MNKNNKESKDKHHIASTDTFSPDECLLTTLRRAVANGQNIHIDGGAHGSLVILGASEEYFSENPNLAEFLQLSPGKFRITVMAQNDSNTYAGTACRDINELMWQAAYYASNGRLMSGYHRSDVVELESWPNLTRLPHTPNTFGILTLFYKHPTSVALAARLLKVPEAEVNQIYTAARASGYARAINRKAEEPHIVPHPKQSLLASLLRKLTGN
ncbi:hypothetical protein [Marinobacter salexigens]|uniref:hypothetical protein n=1 Tax=Marinobacter salexigens TaxID=1925763 RepID=UPI000C2827D6|nr:hypothetical protein [Marinobacter salexigens]